VKRSDREGRWAEPPSARVRFALEAAFLVLVATGAALAELGPLAIIIIMAAAWLLVALVERAISRPTFEAPIAIDEDAIESSPDPIAPVPAQEAYRWLFWRRSRGELPEPTAGLEERPSRAHVRRLEPEAEPDAASAPVAVAEPEPEPEAGPAVTTRRLDLPGLEEPPEPAEAAPARPRFAALRARAAERAPAPPPPPPVPPAQEWNLWDLERRAREQAGTGPQDEEWSALFTHLRVFANADGVLPKEFDGLVRESFGTLIEAA
jgi:hypothetical protein